MPENKQTAAVKILEQDPRPAYDTDESRAYGVTFSGFDIRSVSYTHLTLPTTDQV